MEPTDKKADIPRRVIELAAEQTGVDPSGVSLASHFINDLNWDSLDFVDFQMKVEDEFEFSLPDEDAPALQTVEKVVEYVLMHGTERERNRPQMK